VGKGADKRDAGAHDRHWFRMGGLLDGPPVTHVEEMGGSGGSGGLSRSGARRWPAWNSIGQLRGLLAEEGVLNEMREGGAMGR